MSDGSRAVESGMRELLPGEMVSDRYRVVSLIGSGAMGSVYCVEQVFLKQQFALKTLNPIAASDNNTRRFQKEAQAAGRLDHPNLVRSTDFGLIDGIQPFFVMDLVRGETLQEYLKNHGTMPWETALKVFIPLCFAINYAHQEGVIHRDIKPGNIVLIAGNSADSEPIAKIVDFGIAKVLLEETEGQALTRTGEIFGTPLYMSPEQCSGTGVDNRSDIYSLGCVLFEVLTGAPPFRGHATLETLVKHLNEPSPSLKEASLGKEFPQALELVLAKMLAKDPNHRYSFAGDVAKDLISLQHGKTDRLTSQSSSAPSTSPQSPTGIGSTLVWCALLCAIAMGAFVVGRYTAGNLTSAQIPDVRLQLKQPASVPDDKEILSALAQPDIYVGAYTPFSKLTENKEWRQFDFGSSRVGTLLWATANAVPVPARVASGRVLVPAANPIWFETDWTILQHNLALLRRFRPDDLYSLSIRPRVQTDINPPTEQVDVDDDALYFARRLTSLKQLVLKGPVSAQGLKNMHIDGLPNLDNLELGNTVISAEELSRMQIIKRLVTLRLKRMKNGGVILKALRNSPNITSLALDEVELTDHDLAACATMPHLVQLQLMNEPGITDGCIAEISKIKSLRKLEMTDCGVNKEFAKELGKLPLRNFSVDAPPSRNSRNSDEQKGLELH